MEVDHDRREAVVAWPGGEVIGLADCTRLPDGSTVELGVVVADRWQRQGLGPRLPAPCSSWRRPAARRLVRLHALADNDRVGRLVRRTWPGRVPRRDGAVLAWDLPIRHLWSGTCRLTA